MFGVFPLIFTFENYCQLHVYTINTQFPDVKPCSIEGILADLVGVY